MRRRSAGGQRGEHRDRVGGGVPLERAGQVDLVAVTGADVLEDGLDRGRGSARARATTAPRGPSRTRPRSPSPARVGMRADRAKRTRRPSGTAGRPRRPARAGRPRPCGRARRRGTRPRARALDRRWRRALPHRGPPAPPRRPRPPASRPPAAARRRGHRGVEHDERVGRVHLRRVSRARARAGGDTGRPGTLDPPMKTSGSSARAFAGRFLIALLVGSLLMGAAVAGRQPRGRHASSTGSRRSSSPPRPFPRAAPTTSSSGSDTARLRRATRSSCDAFGDPVSEDGKHSDTIMVIHVEPEAERTLHRVVPPRPLGQHLRPRHGRRSTRRTTTTSRRSSTR